MPRANRFRQPGRICHLTHRCHDASFLLRFARDRSDYRERLRQAARRFQVVLLNYSVTSSHTHEIALELVTGAISRMIQTADGEFASSYNSRKNRSGPYWEDRYHCTMVDSGEYLWNCIQYVDLNMVRAGVVSHPRDWEWCGYRELLGERVRYRLLDVERICEMLGLDDVESFRVEYSRRIEHAIEARRLNRERRWTESIAVGRRSYVENVVANMRYGRLKPRIEEEEDGSWAVWEQSSAYQVKR